MEYDLNDIVEMKKQHPCKKSNQWKIIRMGADINPLNFWCENELLLLLRFFVNKALKQVFLQYDFFLQLQLLYPLNHN